MSKMQTVLIEHICTIQALFSPCEPLHVQRLLDLGPKHNGMAAVCQIIILSAMCVGHSHEKLCREENSFNI